MKVKPKEWLEIKIFTMREALAFHERLSLRDKEWTGDPPSWLGREDFHSAHRAILLAKDPTYYVKFGWKEKPAVKNLRDQYPYVWPV